MNWFSKTCTVLYGYIRTRITWDCWGGDRRSRVVGLFFGSDWRAEPTAVRGRVRALERHLHMSVERLDVHSLSPLDLHILQVLTTCTMNDYKYCTVYTIIFNRL